MATQNSIDNRSEPMKVGNLKIEGNTISSTNVNGDINITADDGYFPIYNIESTAGYTSGIRVRNSDNTNTGSKAILHLESGGASAQDPFARFASVVNWSMGIDNSDSDIFKIVNNIGVSYTAQSLRFTTAGEVLKNRCPAFCAYNYGTDLNVTGDGTVVDPVDFSHEAFDVGENFASDAFTSPIDGRYRFGVSVDFIGIGTATLGQVDLATSNRTWYGPRIGLASAVDGNGYCGLTMSCLCDMDSGDTARIKALANGAGGLTVDIRGQSSPMTFFCGYLAA